MCSQSLQIQVGPTQNVFTISELHKAGNQRRHHAEQHGAGHRQEELLAEQPKAEVAGQTPQPYALQPAVQPVDEQQGQKMTINQRIMRPQV